jgi:hypothetical protein
VLDAIGADEVGVVNFSAIAATLGGGNGAETAVLRLASRAPMAVGSVKWGETSPFSDRDLAKLAAARSVIPHAERASLLAVSPHGVAAGVGVDMVLDAADLLAAWEA